MRKPWFLLLVLLAAPAQAQAGEHVITWTQDIHHVNALTGWDGDVVSINITRPHSWTVVSSQITVVIAVNIAIEGSNVNRFLNVAIEGNVLDFCTNAITTAGALAQKWNYGGGGPCPSTSGGTEQAVIGVAQNWTFSNTGTATVNFLHASVFVTIQETVLMDIDINTAIDYWIPILLSAGILILSAERTISRHYTWLIGVMLGAVAVVATAMQPYGVDFPLVLVPLFFTLTILLRVIVAFNIKTKEGDL